MRLWKSQRHLLNPLSEKKKKNSLVRRMVFDVSTQSRRSESHRLTSGQHRTQWSMFKLLLSLSHTYSDSPTYTNTQFQRILSHRTQCSQGVIYCKVVEASQTITVRLLHKAKGNGKVCVCSHFLPTSQKPFQMNQLINSPKMTQDGSLGGVKNTFLPPFILHPNCCISCLVTLSKSDSLLTSPGDTEQLERQVKDKGALQSNWQKWWF